MFCHTCGHKLEETFLFCPQCGNKSESVTCKEKVLTSFSTFSEEKAKERAQFFRPKPRGGGAKGRSKVKQRIDDLSDTVKVNIGIMQYSDYGLQPLRGKGLLVSVTKGCKRDELLKAGADKHKAHSGNVLKSTAFALLYPDGTEVNTLKESDEEFVLYKYKDECGKPYNRVTFYICCILDLSKSRLGEYIQTSEPESSSESGEENERLVKNKRAKTNGNERSAMSVTSTATATSVLESDSEIQINQQVEEGNDSDLCVMFESASPNPDTVGSHQCPTCFLHFNLNEIERHADACAQAWVDPIGQCEVSEVREGENEGESSEENTSAEQPEPETSTAELLAGIKNAVGYLKSNLQMDALNRISVRRSCLFADYVAARRKRWFKPKGSLKVTFIGEPSVDDGGPKREFFTETLSHIRCTLLDNDGVPYPDMRALASEEFKIAGELFVCSIIQGGPAPCCFAEIVYDYIVDGITSVTTEGWAHVIHDNSLKKCITQMADCKSDVELRELLSQDAMFDTLQSIGYRGVPSRETLNSVPAITRSMVVTGIAKTLTVIDQLVVGMGYLGGLFVDYIRNHQAIMRPLFTISGAKQFTPTADLLLDGMTPDYSADGSNLKAREINVYKHFNDYVMDLEELSGGMQKLYKFITGSDRFTPLGMEKTIAVKFKYGCGAGCKCRPTASTCDPSIMLPVHCQDYQSLEHALNSAMDEGVGFGLI